MRDVLAQLLQWWESGSATAVSTVVHTARSAPRPPGAVMLVGPDGQAVGSVSGGCVESAVYEVGTTVRDGAAAQLNRYGYSDDDAFAVGLTCGGILDVFTDRWDRQTFPEFGELASAVQRGEPVALAQVIGGPADRVGRHRLIWPDRAAGSLGGERIDHVVSQDARGLLAAGRTGVVEYGADGDRMDRGRAAPGLRVFIASFAPAPRMIVFGAIDFAAAVARIGQFLGYRVTVCDARPLFATARRFPGVDEVVVDWPHRYLHGQIEHSAVDARTAICVLTHDPKFDVPVLRAALRSPAGYVGAMGSRRTHEQRLAQLRRDGLTDTELAALHSPIGLDLGSRTPEETAISIAAEIISNRWDGSGSPLSAVAGPIHADRSAFATEPA